MQESWTIERVLQLAPDPASAKAGQGLGSARKWVSSGLEDNVLWGECQGSGAKPYQVQIDLGEPAFKCSCPSRKFPCKHAIGLMLIHAGGGVTAAAKPQWVAEWLAGRIERIKKKQEKADAPPKPLDAEAQANRRAKRLERIGQGLSATRIWAEDLIRGGIAAVPSQGYEFFDQPARRLVDAQAPGAARMVRDLASVAGSGAGWQRSFVSSLSSLYLLTRAFDSVESLGEETSNDVLTALGMGLEPDRVLARAGVRDTWQVVAREVETEDRLRAQRTWLFGATARRVALVLHFAHGTAPLDASLAPATEFDGEISFFGDNQVRALVRTRENVRAIDVPAGFDSLEAACIAYGDALSRQPWLGEIVLPIRQIVPDKTSDGWRFIDASGRAMPARFGGDHAWTCAAVSGGHPIDVAAAFDGGRLRPLGAFAGGEYVSLADATGAEA